MFSRGLRSGIGFITARRDAKENGKGRTAGNLRVTCRGVRVACGASDAGRAAGSNRPDLLRGVVRRFFDNSVTHSYDERPPRTARLPTVREY
ncbi:hypothetical protein Bcen2424_4346 [Burkholderia cenocepacia HI2424]|nr:hypothetical protein Bcen2424_4346 [Burkholderia cenocepacia HI2424]